LDRLTAMDDAAEVVRRRAVLDRHAPFRDLTCGYDWEGFQLVVALHGVPVRDADGMFRGYRGCARDMTRATPAPARSAAALPPPRKPLDAIVVPVLPPVPAMSTDSTHRRLDILVAEDDAVNSLVIGGFLTPHGHTVTFAPDGEQAVAQARGKRFDIILMDVMMPSLDGPSATRIIRALPSPLGDVPIIALTANAMQGDRERYLAEGMTDYVTKPINRGLLFATIERAIGAQAFTAVSEPRSTTPATSDPKQAAMLDALTESLDL
jgi:CheY-like chemotaxis protein